MARKYIYSGSPWEKMAGYARAIADGPWVFVAGTVGVDQRTWKLPRGARAQAECALDIIERALKQAGATLDDAVRVRVYLTSPRELPIVGAVLKKRLGRSQAPNTTVCAPLVVPGAKVEIEVTALKRRPSRTSGRARRRK